MPEASANSIRHHLAVVFEDEEPRSALTRVFNMALAVLIVLNVSCVVLESVEEIRRHFAPAFDLFEQAATALDEKSEKPAKAISPSPSVVPHT